jgi:serine/threonine protein kinase
LPPQDPPASKSSYPCRFGPRFILLKELGKGGMGHVFMALTGQAGVERVCALKILKEVRAGRDAEELTQRFLDEAKVVTKLSHENLVYVFDFGIHDRRGYLAMEYVEGKSITETWNRCAARKDGFPIGLSLYYVAELVSALWYAANVEGLGLVHRDISPSNVMLTYTGGIKLIDFGLAKWSAKVVQTAAGVQWGKTSYMSPEQYTGKPVDHRSDLFSAGVILWELLTGRQLFPPSEARVPHAAVPAPSRYTREVTPELDRVVLRALAIPPEQRYQSGEEMCAALLAEMPNEPGGKLQAAKFIARLFETEIRDEAAERRELVERAAHIDEAAPLGTFDSPAVSSEIGEGETTPDLDPDGLVGKVLSDRYYIRRLVGEGAMGRVYEGHHTGIGKRVAIKIAHKGERRKTEVAKRIQREATAPAQIGHPNVADVTDCGTTPGGEFFFVMEFIDGVSLDAVIRRDGQLTIERALAIAVQICRALEAAHRAGIIHRDLKPSNVMLIRSQDQEDVVKVLDFGVAKFLHDTGDGGNLTLTDASVGTPKYMAPEQIRGGGKVDFRSDIYALGAILYTMLAGGRLPVEGATIDELWQRKLTRDAQPLSDHRSDLPPDLEELVLGCLARDQAKRPSSAQSLKKRLVAHLEASRAMGDSILGMKSPSQTEVLGERRRRRRVRLGIALAVGTAIAFAAIGIALVRSPRRPTGPNGADRPAASAAASQPGAQVAPQPVAAPPPVPSAGPGRPTAALGVPSPVAKPSTSGGEPVAGLASAAPRAKRRTVEPTLVPEGGKVEKSATPVAEPHPMRPRGAGQTQSGDEQPAEGAPSKETVAAAITKAEAAFSGGHMAVARIAATEAVAAASQAPRELRVRAFVIMGKVELASERFGEAERAFARALAIDPDNPVARKGKERAREAAAAGLP